MHEMNLESLKSITGGMRGVLSGHRRIDDIILSDEDKKNKGLQEVTSNVYGNGHTSLFADVMDAIEHDRKPYVDAVAGRNALEMILAIYQSAATGVPVKLPLKNVASIDFIGRFNK